MLQGSGFLSFAPSLSLLLSRSVPLSPPPLPAPSPLSLSVED